MNLEHTLTSYFPRTTFPPLDAVCVERGNLKLKAQKDSHISSRNVPYIILNDFERDPNL